MPIARLLGIVDVPVFRAPYDMTGAGTSFLDQLGFAPAYQPFNGNAMAGKIRNLRHRILNLNGIADYTVTSSATGATSTDCSPTFIDGRIYTVCNWRTRFPSGSLVSADLWAFSQVANRTPGVYPFGTGKYTMTPTTVNRWELRSRAVKLWVPPTIDTILNNVGWLTAQSGSQTMNAMYLNYGGDGAHMAECFNVGVSLDQLGFGTSVQTGQNYGHLSDNELLGGNYYETGIGLPFTNRALTISSFAAPNRLRLVVYKPGIFGSGGASSNSTMQTVTIDDAVLNNIAQNNSFALGQSANGWISQWRGGFLLSLVTNGTGPTGQQSELLVFNRDCDGYHLLRTIPQNAAASEMLARNNVKAFKIDEDGTIWFRATDNSAPTDRVFFTYAPALFFNPRLLDFDLSSPVLPCYNTCLPGGQ